MSRRNGQLDTICDWDLIEKSFGKKDWEKCADSIGIEGTTFDIDWDVLDCVEAKKGKTVNKNYMPTSVYLARTFIKTQIPLLTWCIPPKTQVVDFASNLCFFIRSQTRET